MACWEKKFHESVLYATKKHMGQYRKGPHSLPYILHPLDVADEVGRYSGLKDEDLWKSMIVAVLHDTIEDTDATYDDIKKKFGVEIAEAVQALSKNKKLKIKRLMFLDAMDRISEQPVWVQVVKMADRFCNLKEYPSFWERDKIISYLGEAEEIANIFHDSSPDMSVMLMAEVVGHRNLLSATS